MMNTYSTIYQLAEEQQLLPAQIRALVHDSLIRKTPARPDFTLWRLASLLSAAFCGFGLIMWIAANWDLMGRGTHFILLQALIILPLLVAIPIKMARIPLALLALCGIGALFAFYGQTYQTGADPWQLFATWAALGLPLCLAARNNALWIPWSLVTLTALSLWLYTQTGYTMLGITRDDFPIHTAWLFCCTLLLLLQAPQLGKWTGAGSWSQRATLLLICWLLIAVAYMANKTAYILPQYYLVGIWLIMAFALFSWRPLYDLVNVSILLFSIDAVLLLRLYHFFFDHFQQHPNKEYLLLIGGIFATLLFAASGLVIIKMNRFYERLQKRQEEHKVKSAEENNASAIEITQEQEQKKMANLAKSQITEQPWPLTLFTGLGAWLATLLLGIGIFAVCTLFFTFTELTNFFLVIGLICIAASSIALCQKKLPLFLIQAFLPVLFVGLTLFAYALLVHSSSLSATMLSIFCFCLIIAFFIHPPWHRILLGFAAACSGAAVITDQLDQYGLFIGNSLWLLGLSCGLLLIWALFLLAQRLCIRWTWGRDVALFLEYCSGGWLILALIMLCTYSGGTFLLGGILKLPAQSGFIQAQSWQQHLVTAVPSIIVSLAACGWLAFCWPDLRKAKNLGIAFLLCALTFFMPALAVALLALSISLASGRRLLALITSIAIAWIIGAFYYQLHWPLIHKAQLLASVGLVLALLVALFRDKATKAKRTPFQMHWPSAVPLCLCLLATLLVANISIQKKETIIAHGRPVLVSLRPVDPRSLMQGDYMSLNFPLPFIPMDGLRPGEAPVVRVIVDESGLATIRRDQAGVDLGPGEYRVRLTHTTRGWVFVTNAWHFKEGEGERWAKAEFGEFRLLDNGSALLVGMRDRDRKPI